MATAYDTSLFICLVATKISNVHYKLMSFKYRCFGLQNNRDRRKDHECLTH